MKYNVAAYFIIIFTGFVFFTNAELSAWISFEEYFPKISDGLKKAKLLDMPCNNKCYRHVGTTCRKIVGCNDRTSN